MQISAVHLPGPLLPSPESLKCLLVRLLSTFYLSRPLWLTRCVGVVDRGKDGMKLLLQLLMQLRLHGLSGSCCCRRHLTHRLQCRDKIPSASFRSHPAAHCFPVLSILRLARLISRLARQCRAMPLSAMCLAVALCTLSAVRSQPFDFEAVKAEPDISEAVQRRENNYTGFTCEASLSRHEQHCWMLPAVKV